MEWWYCEKCKGKFEGYEYEACPCCGSHNTIPCDEND